MATMHFPWRALLVVSALLLNQEAAFAKSTACQRLLNNPMAPLGPETIKNLPRPAVSLPAVKGQYEKTSEFKARRKADYERELKEAKPKADLVTTGLPAKYVLPVYASYNADRETLTVTNMASVHKTSIGDLGAFYTVSQMGKTSPVGKVRLSPTVSFTQMGTDATGIAFKANKLHPWLGGAAPLTVRMARSKAKDLGDAARLVIVGPLAPPYGHLYSEATEPSIAKKQFGFIGYSVAVVKPECIAVIDMTNDSIIADLTQ